VLDDDTEDTLAERVLEQEHRIYPQAVLDLMSGALKLVDGRVVRSTTK